MRPARGRGRGERDVIAGVKAPLSAGLIRAILQHVSGITASDLEGYNCERRPSDFPGARWDIIVYDRADQPVLFGRDFSGGPTPFWWVVGDLERLPSWARGRG